MATKGFKKVSVLAVLLLSVLALAVALYVLRQRPPEPPQPPAPLPEKLPPVVEKKPSARIAIVIDDMGYDMKPLEELLKLKAPITIAVLPHLTYSRKIAERAHLEGIEVLLHLPMEPKNTKRHNPGEGALYTNMDEKEIRLRLEADLDAVPYITGVNNHMGSRFTEDADKMKPVLMVLKEKGLFFVDSKTTGRSVAEGLAKSMGLAVASRDVFLDNERDRDYIRGQIEKLKTIAKKRGEAIGIGHPYPETIATLKEVIVELQNDGIELVRVSELTR